MTIEHPSSFAQSAPDRAAAIVANTGATLTYGQLEARSNQVAHALRARRLAIGDHVAVLIDNRAEYFEVVWGAMRAGLPVTPINWHLAADEAEYIVKDCGAIALIAAVSCAYLAGDAGGTCIAIGGDLEGFESYEAVLAAQPTTPVAGLYGGSEWLGPIVYEYYSGSEGVGFCAIGPEEWLTHPGSVGRSLLAPVHIVDDEGKEVPPRTEGQVWFETRSTFEYHGDPEKTAAAFDHCGSGCLGDMGEAERAIIQPAVFPADPDAFASELVEFCRDRIAQYKCTRSVRFLDQLPRLPTGKIARRLLPPELSETVQ